MESSVVVKTTPPMGGDPGSEGVCPVGPCKSHLWDRPV